MIDCSACHLRTDPAGYASTPSDCFACHEAEYRSNTVHPSHLGDPSATPPQPPFPRDCSLCHTTIGWTPAFLPAGFASGAATSAAIATATVTAGPEHERFFPLRTGVHRALACDACHADATRPSALDVQCTGCHDHSAFALAAQHRGRPMPSDAQACLRCHPGGAAR